MASMFQLSARRDERHFLRFPTEATFNGDVSVPVNWQSNEGAASCQNRRSTATTNVTKHCFYDVFGFSHANLLARNWNFGQSLFGSEAEHMETS